MTKVAVVTGSSSGFGLLTSVELARRGFRVVATMRDLGRRGKLEEAAAKAGVSNSIEVRSLDITDHGIIPYTVGQIVNDHGRVDVLVNNAGFALAGFAEDIKLEELRQQFETNFFGHVALTKAVLPTMRAQKSGHIIMVASIAGRAATPVIGSYAASKFALEGWTEALRIEIRSLGIHAVLVEPGAFETDIWTRNVQLGSTVFDGNSPNRERGARFADNVKKDHKKRPDAQRVATLIGRVAETPNPRLRYMIGADAHIQFWLRALLPWKVYEKMIAKVTKID